MTTDHKQRARELLRGYVDHFRAAASLGRALTHVEIDELESTIEAVLAQSAQQAGAVSEGFVLVPRVATEEMLRAACNEWHPGPVWRKMLAAAPPAPSGGWRSIEGECVEIGDDEEGQPRILIHTTRDAIKGGPPLAFRRVIVAPAPVKQEGVDRG